MALFLAAAAVSALGFRPLWALDAGQTIGLIVIFWMLLMPLGITYAKYQSLVLKEEK